jgi:hypothetical protein
MYLTSLLFQVVAFPYDNKLTTLPLIFCCGCEMLNGNGVKLKKKLHTLICLVSSFMQTNPFILPCFYGCNCKHTQNYKKKCISGHANSLKQTTSFCRVKHLVCKILQFMYTNTSFRANSNVTMHVFHAHNLSQPFDSKVSLNLS